MYHPILMKYAEVQGHKGERLKSVLNDVIERVNLSFDYDKRVQIDNISWGRMAIAINHPEISDEDFADVYTNGWDEQSLLYRIMSNIVLPVDFEGKKLEDYL